MTIRKATPQDRDTLIQIRIDFLAEDKGVLTIEEEQEIRAQLSAYFESHIDRDFFAVLAEEEGKAVSCVFLVITERPANTVFLNGKSGTIHNVYTYPQYRKRGHASTLLQEILNEAKRQDVCSVELIATPAGKPLYEKHGFDAIKNTYMRLRKE